MIEGQEIYVDEDGNPIDPRDLEGVSGYEGDGEDYDDRRGEGDGEDYDEDGREEGDGEGDEEGEGEGDGEGGDEREDGPFRNVPMEQRQYNAPVEDGDRYEMREDRDRDDLDMDVDDGDSRGEDYDQYEDIEGLGPQGDGDDQERDDQDRDDEDLQNLNYEVYDPDEDDDFPEYANEHNKKLNDQIKEERKRNKEIGSKVEDITERLGIMEEHHKNINQELKNTQALIDAKNQETDTEKHLSQVADRQIGRITRELGKLDNNGVEFQDRLNDTQQQIFRGNEKLDKYKLEINWNQEEMEQWA
jgi:hypothetical protein